MNKDLDERLVPNGQYRDAMNIQITNSESGQQLTSALYQDGSQTAYQGEGAEGAPNLSISSGIGNIGTAQNLKGNQIGLYPIAINLQQFLGEDAPPEETSGETDTRTYINPSINQDSSNPDMNVPRVVGAVADEANNCAYFFFSSPFGIAGTNNLGPFTSSVAITNKLIIFCDRIVKLSRHKKVSASMGQDEYENVFVDKWAVIGSKKQVFNTTPISEFADEIINTVVNPTYLSNTIFQSNPADGYDQIVVQDASQYRVGMRFYAQEGGTTSDPDNNFITGYGDDLFCTIVRIDTDNNILTLSHQQTADLNDAFAFRFIHPERVLQFDQFTDRGSPGFTRLNNISSSSIKVIDDLLIWSDGKNEPKMLNIPRSIEGTRLAGNVINKINETSFGINISDQNYSFYSTGELNHTKLVVKNPNSGVLESISTLENLNFNEVSDDVKLENITVIKKCPKQQLIVELKESDRDTDTVFQLNNFKFMKDTDGDGDVDDDDDIPAAGDTTQITFPDNITYRINDKYIFTAANTDKLVTIRGRISSIDENNSNLVTIEILFVDKDLEASRNPQNWTVELEKRPAIFESKFGRFAYRYQYEDNQYSAFSPWSELAFLPGDFEYSPQQGFNNGMNNNTREIIIKGFLSTVYSRPLDVKAIDILWKTTDDQNVYLVKTITREVSSEWKDGINNSNLNETGTLVLTSQLIHQVVEGNQILRAWDNVPRYAKALDLVANRLMFGNYVQGYNVDSTIGLRQRIKSEVVDFPEPKKSVKSLRTYQWGLVLGDKFGRETPVLSNGYKEWNGEILPSTTNVPKDVSKFSNKFNLKQSWEGSDPTSLPWIDYVKYYVKETSNEYYNLVLDRWYNSGDDSVWLAFNSADRNKVDEETYLVLKNEHGGQGAIDEEARYKIIAIENEAPDFIKTEQRKFKKVELDKIFVYGDANNDGNVDNVSDAVPNALVGQDSIGVQDGIELDLTKFKGIAKVRFDAEFTDSDGTVYSAHSPYRTVTAVDNTSGSKSVDIREPYTLGDINLYQRILTQLPDATALSIGTADTDNNFKYFIRFADFVVENKPKFDGKFFVKVNKDSVLENRVLSNSLGEYEVLNTYEMAFIANEVNNPALDGNEYSAEMDFEDQDWETLGGITSSNVVSDLGQNSVNSANYWTAWKNSPNRTADIFIDQVPAIGGSQAAAFNLDAPGQGNFDALVDFNSGNAPINGSGSSSNWQPKGLSNGTFSGSRGQLTLSVIYGDGEQPWVGTNSYFKAKMQQPGSLFRFRDDPNQVIYRVFQSTQNITSGGSISGPINIESKNYNVGDGDDSCINRSTIIVRFEAIDIDNQSLQVGLDHTIWDPRGEVKHNGLGSITIDFVQRVAPDNLSDDSVSTNCACFETEPKEDINLDIYHEASSAVPVRLKAKNIIDFVGAHKIQERASSFTVDKRKLESQFQTNFPFESVDIPDSFVYQAIQDNNIEVRKLGTTTRLTTTITNSVSDGICAGIGDKVDFNQKNGMVTTAIITDHKNLLFSGITVPSDRYTFNANGVNFNPAIIGIPVGTANANNITVGMQVTGDTTDKGTFVTSIANNGINFTITLNKLLISGGASDFTFIEVTGIFELDREVWKQSIDLNWNNCYSFGNGVESDRIRDDFNAPQIDNGFKVSSTFLNYGEENISSGIIYSGLYNSISSVNNLNEFNMAEKITKNLNTAYGSIQAMVARDNDVVVFAEDKVLRVLSSGRDALFNADGNPQLTATDKVLGTAIPYAGDYGISDNPHSLAIDSGRMYFTDRKRGAVLRLSRDGLTPISDIGMQGFFRKNLRNYLDITGSFDPIAGEYNVALHEFRKIVEGSRHISYNEKVKGWVSFKSFIPRVAVGVTDAYFSCSGGGIYRHYSDLVERNSFYGSTMGSSTNPSKESKIEIIFNQQPSIIKSFKTINYEGSQARINQFTTETTDDDGNSIGFTANDEQFYNLSPKTGWYVEHVRTNAQTGNVPEFIKKEGKWFNNLIGSKTYYNSKFDNNIDTREFSVQGIGFVLQAPTIPPTSSDGGVEEDTTIFTQTEVDVTVVATDPDLVEYEIDKPPSDDFGIDVPDTNFEEIEADINKPPADITNVTTSSESTEIEQNKPQ